MAYMVSPVLATWHRNWSNTGDTSFFPFFSKSEDSRGKNKSAVHSDILLPLTESSFQLHGTLKNKNKKTPQPYTVQSFT